jgi:hypothetical protein
MLGDGPAITLLDNTIQPISGSPNTHIIGDETNNGLWLMYIDHVVFWDIGTQTTKYTIPIAGSPQCNAICLDETASTVYVLDAGPFFNSGNNVIQVIDATSGTVSKTIDLSSINGFFPPYLHSSLIQTYGGTVWLSADVEENYYFFDVFMPPANIYAVNPSTNAITTYDKSADFTVLSFSGIINQGYLYLQCITLGDLLVNSSGSSASYDPSFTVLTDPSVDFIAAGVTPGNFFWWNSNLFSGNVNVLSVDSAHQITLDNAVPSSVTFTKVYGISTLDRTTIFVNYSATTGAMSSEPTLNGLAFSPYTVNRQTGTLFSIDQNDFLLWQIVDPYSAMLGEAFLAAPIEYIAGAAAEPDGLGSIAADAALFQGASAAMDGDSDLAATTFLTVYGAADVVAGSSAGATAGIFTRGPTFRGTGNLFIQDALVKVFSSFRPVNNQMAIQEKLVRGKPGIGIASNYTVTPPAPHNTRRGGTPNKG